MGSNYEIEIEIEISPENINSFSGAFFYDFLPRLRKNTDNNSEFNLVRWFNLINYVI